MFKDVLYVNKYARNCPEHSNMRTLNVGKFKFSGPDPPNEPGITEEAEQTTEEVKAAAGGKKADPKKAEEQVEV